MGRVRVIVSTASDGSSGPPDGVPSSSEVEPGDRAHLVHLATVVVAARKANGETQKEMADRTEMSRTVISRIEQANRNVGYCIIRELLCGLGMDWATFGAELQAIDPLPLWNPPAPSGAAPDENR